MKIIFKVSDIEIIIDEVVHSDRTLTMRYNDQNKQLQDTLNVISECCLKLLKIKQEGRDDKRTGIEK